MNIVIKTSPIGTSFYRDLSVTETLQNQPRMPSVLIVYLLYWKMLVW